VESGLTVFPPRPSLKWRKRIAAHAIAPIAAGRQAQNDEFPVPLIGEKRPEIQFPHENIKSIPPGSNPSKKHRADRRIISPSDQEPSRAVQPPRFARTRRVLRASHRRE
jgi:hypothetical protein